MALSIYTVPDLRSVSCSLFPSSCSSYSSFFSVSLTFHQSINLLASLSIPFSFHPTPVPAFPFHSHLSPQVLPVSPAIPACHPCMFSLPSISSSLCSVSRPFMSQLKDSLTHDTRSVPFLITRLLLISF